MSNSLQYRRTHKAIVLAFIAVASNKSFENITVQDILDEALVSRYTFYKHFKDKYEIAEVLQAQLMQEFKSVVEHYRLKNPNLENVRRNQLESYYRLSSEYREIFATLINIHTDSINLEKVFREEFRQRYLEWEYREVSSKYAELEADLYASIQTEMMIHFAMESNMNIDLLGDSTHEALTNVFLSLIGVESFDGAKNALKPFLRKFQR